LFTYKIWSIKAW